MNKRNLILILLCLGFVQLLLGLTLGRLITDVHLLDLWRSIKVTESNEEKFRFFSEALRNEWGVMVWVGAETLVVICLGALITRYYEAQSAHPSLPRLVSSIEAIWKHSLYVLGGLQVAMGFLVKPYQVRLTERPFWVAMGEDPSYAAAFSKMTTSIAELWHVVAILGLCTVAATYAFFKSTGRLTWVAE